MAGDLFLLLLSLIANDSGSPFISEFRTLLGISLALQVKTGKSSFFLIESFKSNEKKTCHRVIIIVVSFASPF